MASIFGPKLTIFGSHFDSFLDSAESGAPHENTINSNEKARLGRLEKRPKNLQQLKRKQYENEDENQTPFLMHFELILGGFSDPKCFQKGSNNITKNLSKKRRQAGATQDPEDTGRWRRKEVLRLRGRTNRRETAVERDSQQLLGGLLC